MWIEIVFQHLIYRCLAYHIIRLRKGKVHNVQTAVSACGNPCSCVTTPCVSQNHVTGELVVQILADKVILAHPPLFPSIFTQLMPTWTFKLISHCQFKEFVLKHNQA